MAVRTLVTVVIHVTATVRLDQLDCFPLVVKSGLLKRDSARKLRLECVRERKTERASKRECE